MPNLQASACFLFTPPPTPSDHHDPPPPLPTGTSVSITTTTSHTEIPTTTARQVRPSIEDYLPCPCPKNGDEESPGEDLDDDNTLGAKVNGKCNSGCVSKMKMSADLILTIVRVRRTSKLWLKARLHTQYIWLSGSHPAIFGRKICLARTSFRKTVVPTTALI